jgi:hypothetical protein
MTEQDVTYQKDRLRRWENLTAYAEKLTKAIAALETISGNTSQVRKVRKLTISRGLGDGLEIIDSGLTDYEIRVALVPILRARREEIWEARRAI